MYYHGSPTPHQLKAIKAAKAAEMKQLTNAMKLVTSKYAETIDLLEELRGVEIELSNAINQCRLSDEQLELAQKALEKNRRKAARLVKKLLPGFKINN